MWQCSAGRWPPGLRAVQGRGLSPVPPPSLVPRRTQLAGGCYPLSQGKAGPLASALAACGGAAEPCRRCQADVAAGLWGLGWHWDALAAAAACSPRRTCSSLPVRLVSAQVSLRQLSLSACCSLSPGALQPAQLGLLRKQLLKASCSPLLCPFLPSQSSCWGRHQALSLGANPDARPGTSLKAEEPCPAWCCPEEQPRGGEMQKIPEEEP